MRKCNLDDEMDYYNNFDNYKIDYNKIVYNNKISKTYNDFKKKNVCYNKFEKNFDISTNVKFTTNIIEDNGYNIESIKGKEFYIMDPIEKYMEDNSVYYPEIKFIKINQKNIPTIGDVSIGDILSTLAKNSMKEAVILKYNTIDLEKINKALEFSARILNMIDDEEKIIERFINNKEMNEVDKIKYRVKIFKENICTAKDIEEIFYFNPLEENFYNRYLIWNEFKFKEKVNKELFNIRRISEYLEWANVTPKKLAAARWGLTEKDFDKVINKVVDVVDIKNEDIHNDILNNYFIESIPKYLFIDKYKNNIESFIENLKCRLDYNGTELKKLQCATSQFLNDNPVKVASGFDDLTGEPLCEEYSVLLRCKIGTIPRKFICSIKTFLKFEDILGEYLDCKINDNIRKKFIEEFNKYENDI